MEILRKCFLMGLNDVFNNLHGQILETKEEKWAKVDWKWAKAINSISKNIEGKEPIEEKGEEK